jgi:amino-acid N-acetyltransferase
MEARMIRRAEPVDLAAVLALLVEADLPTDGVAESFASFVVIEEGGRVLAAAGVELHGGSALLRSLVVAPDARGAGHGAAVLRRALDEGQQHAGAVYALTTTAASYLSRFGFEPIARDVLPPELFQSPELRGACPSSATVMRLGAR